MIALRPPRRSATEEHRNLRFRAGCRSATVRRVAGVERQNVVWVVDDSFMDSELAARVLSERYEVEIFRDGATALERLGTGYMPAAIVLDWLMPDVSGLDVIEYIRRELRLARLGILLLTAQQATEQIVRGLAAGADDYLSKPYAPEELRARVDALVRARTLWERVERAEETVRRLLDNHPEGLLAVDPTGEILYGNDKAAVFLATDDVCGRSIDEVVPQLAPSVRRGDRGDIGDFELEGRVLSPSFSQADIGPMNVVLVALRDVTEERRAIARRVDFYSMIAHDLRSPLQAIRLRCELALQGVLREPDQIEDCFQKISAHTTHLVALIDDFLQIGQFDTTREARREPVNIAELLHEAIVMLEPLARKKDIELSVRAPDRADVLGDRARLSQVIANIVGNAIKFTPCSGHVTTELAFADHATVELSVTDDGPGISDEDLPFIFDRYRRASANDQGGTGLGLTIVRQVVDAHAGKVGVVSHPGQGSRFWVRLPCASAP